MSDSRSHYRVEVVCDSIYGPGSSRLTTIRVRMPRVVLAQLNTHGLLVRSAQSSRAVPTKKLISNAEMKRFVPWNVGKNKPGMQPGELLEASELVAFQRRWNIAAGEAIATAEYFHRAGVHKEIANRVLEPFMFVDVVITATEWTNFLALRTAGDTQGEHAFLAKAIYLALIGSTPKQVREGEWHLPFIGPEDEEFARLMVQRNSYRAQYPTPNIKIEAMTWTLARWSAARCARVSYLLLDKPEKPTPEDDDSTWEKLNGHPKHATPMGHAAIAGDPLPGQRSQLKGWTQMRKLIRGEHIDQFRPDPAEVRRWVREIPEEVFTGDWVD